MALSIQPYKGARDFYPEDMRLQKYMFGVMSAVVESFGYEEYDAPLIEPLELYMAKTGEEIVNEQTYSFTDRGDRKVAIRPEMTPSVSRMVAGKRQELAYPLRWYSTPNLWRYERPQRGRLREHWQLNVDLFGIADLSAEAEIIQIMDAIMINFGAKRDMYTIRLNSRQLMDHILTKYLGLDEVQTHTMRKLIDRMAKIDHAEFVASADAIFTPTQRDAGKAGDLLNLLKNQSLAELPKELAKHPSVVELKGLITKTKASGITNVQFDPSIMRGFDYYTDIVIEVFDNHPDNNRSMFGGGRYDGLVELFGAEHLPVVGFGMGDVTLANFLELHKLTPTLNTETDLYLVLIGDVAAKAKDLVRDLRGMGINVALDQTDRKIDQRIKTAVKKGIKYVLFVGDNELSAEQYMLKNLKTGEEQKLGIERLVSTIKDARHQ